MHSSAAFDLSTESPAARLLSIEQRERLTNILDRYLSSLEEGEPLCPDGLIAEHPDLAAPLRVYLSSLDELHCAAAGFHPGSADHGVQAAPSARDARRLGDFVIGEELGRGGMGIVYKATQISLEKTVALKVLPFAAVLDAKQISRFKNEAQSAAQILHPNIVPVFAIGVDRGVHFYAMQFIDGQSLDRAIHGLRQAKQNTRRARRTASPLRVSEGDVRVDRVESRVCDEVLIARHDSHLHPTEPDPLLSSSVENAPEYFRTAARLGVQASEALHAAHEHGVVHRDIKPSNLLLDRDGKLWVTDFGLARCQRDATLSKTGDIIGTMRYMSPEQALGKRALVDQRTDIYSLGVTLYELLTLEPAVSGAVGPALLRNIDCQTPLPPRRLRPKIPVDLENVVLKAMARSREERYATAQEMADDLRRFLDGRATIARPPTPAERVARWAARHRRLVAASVGIVLLACVGFALSTFLIAREKRNTERNFARAEQNFRDAQDAVDRFGSQFAERLAGIPAAGPVRQEMLRDSLTYYQRFVEQSSDDPALRADLALTYSKMGTLTHEIGSTQEALVAHERALHLFRELVAAEPHVLEHQQRLALCQNNLALTLRKTGQVELSRQAYRRAIELQSELVRHSDNDRYRADQAVSYSNLGQLLSETGDHVGAEDAFRDAIRLQERLVTELPESAERHRHLALTLNNLSTLFVHSDSQQAEQCYQAALQHLRRAADAQPHNLDYVSDSAATYNNLGSLQSQQQRFAAAAESFQQAIRLQRDLLRAAPAGNLFRQDLAISYNNVGLMQSRLSQAADAERAFREALSIQETLVAIHPDDVALRSSVGGVYNNLGIALEEQRSFEEAAIAYQNAVEQQRVANLRAPSVTRYRVFLSKHYFNLGRVLRQLGESDRTAHVALMRRELWPTEPDRLYSVAEELALATRALSHSTDVGEFTAKDTASFALDTLEQAVAAGMQLPPDLASHESFGSLKDNARFLKLLNH